MTSPTARTLETLRALGYTAQVVEHWNPHAKIRQDLFGWVDVIAIHPQHGFLGVQATTSDHLANRATKAMAEPRLRVWLAAGGRAECWGWAKRGPRGAVKRWTCTRRQLTLDDLPEAEAVEEVLGVSAPEVVASPAVAGVVPAKRGARGR